MKHIAFWSAALAASAVLAAVEHPERHVQSQSGEIQILPAPTKEEIPRGKQNWISYSSKLSDAFLATPEAARIAQNVESLKDSARVTRPSLAQ